MSAARTGGSAPSANSASHRRRRLVVEADGGSRGNPGPAGYGALVADAVTGEVLAEVAEGIGRATNNVAEYRGLIAGLREAARIAPGASVEVRMDSKLVVEQMSGRWRIKHPDLQPLASAARDAASALGHVSYVWVPRERNTRADKLANDAMDGTQRLPRGARGREGGAPKGRAVGCSARADSPARPVTGRFAAVDSPPQSAGQPGLEQPGLEQPGLEQPGLEQPGLEQPGLEQPGAGARAAAPGAPGWAAHRGRPTTTVLLRHGQTRLSIERRFAGRGDIDLTDLGVRQAKAAAQRLGRRGDIGAIVTSPLRRARRTAEEAARVTGATVRVEDDLLETDFGAWEGLSFAEVRERWPEELSAWLADADVAPPGGESFAEVDRRVMAALDRLLARYARVPVLVVSHVTPIKTMVRHALAAPAVTLYRMHLDVASLCEVDWYTDGPAVVRSLNDTAHLNA